MSGTLHTPEKYYRSYPIRIAAEISGFALNIAAPTANSAISFESKDGVHLFEPNAIALYVANEQLRGGKDKASEATVLQWSCWADTHIVPAMGTWVYPTLGVIAQQPKPLIEKAREAIHEAFQFLNTHLESRTFLVGERITIADLTVASNARLLFEHVLDPKFRSEFPHVERWFLTIVNQPAALKVIGESVQLCTEEAHYDAKKFSELHPKGDHQQHRGQGRQRQRSHRKSSGSHPDGQDQQHAKPQPKATEKKPKETKPQEPAAAQDDADADEAAPKEPKDPFLKLPKGTFDMDEWKRTYSNNDIESVAMPWLWEHLDTENYSLWQCDYKYNDELTMVFMTCNLVGGMFQRLDRMRKHAFGSVSIYGENKNNCISGAWLWRGQGLAFELESDLQLDYELYEWKKLDPKNEEHRKLVTDYFIQRGEHDGKKFNQGKVFK